MPVPDPNHERRVEAAARVLYEAGRRAPALGAVPFGYRRMAELALAAADSLPPPSAERERELEERLAHIANLSPMAAGNPDQTLQHAQNVARAALRSAEGGEGR